MLGKVVTHYPAAHFVQGVNYFEFGIVRRIKNHKATTTQSAHSAEHSYEEHVAIVDALERGDARAAVRLMEDHLHNVERNLQLDPRMPDLHQVLRPVQ